MHDASENEEKKWIRVIVCRPGERAEVAEIEENLKSLQAVVGGLIEEYTPFTGDDPREDDIAIVCNAYPYEMCSEDKPCL